MQQQHIARHLADYNEAHPIERRPLAQRVAILRGATDQALRMTESWNAKTSAEGLARCETLREQYRALLADLLATTPANERLSATLRDVAELLGFSGGEQQV